MPSFKCSVFLLKTNIKNLVVKINLYYSMASNAKKKLFFQAGLFPIICAVLDKFNELGDSRMDLNEWTQSAAEIFKR